MGGGGCIEEKRGGRGGRNGVQETKTGEKLFFF